MGVMGKIINIFYDIVDGILNENDKKKYGVMVGRNADQLTP